MRIITGIVLLGGKSSRFGSPKAFATYKGQSLYRYSLQALQEVAEEVVISSAPDLIKDFQAREQIKIVEDIPSIKGNGPMAGIYSCMNAVKSDWYIVLPCDMPLVSSEILQRMVKECTDDVDAIVVQAYGRTQPLIAIYHSRMKESLGAFLNKGNLKMMEFLAGHHILYVDEGCLKIEENIFRNVNREGDLKDLMKVDKMVK